MSPMDPPMAPRATPVVLLRFGRPRRSPALGSSLRAPDRPQHWFQVHVQGTGATRPGPVCLLIACCRCACLHLACRPHILHVGPGQVCFSPDPGNLHLFRLPGRCVLLALSNQGLHHLHLPGRRLIPFLLQQHVHRRASGCMWGHLSRLIALRRVSQDVPGSDRLGLREPRQRGGRRSPASQYHMLHSAQPGPRGRYA